MIINTTYDIGEEVYLTTDNDSYKRLIVSIIIKHGGTIEYLLAQGSYSSWHFENEITRERIYTE